MASSSNGNGNLMDEFEEAFQACLHALTKQESNTGVTRDEMELEVRQTANKFIDVARQMEAFFLQKRFLISTLKPEMLLKDENQELRYEIQRKEVLINKHYARLEEWKSLLSDTQQQGYKSIPNQPDMRAITNFPNSSMNPGGSGGGPPIGMMGPGGGMSGVVMQSQIQQQQLQAQQQQQHMLQQQQQLNQIQQMQVNAQQMYMQQGPGNMVNRAGPSTSFNQNSNILQGPLAYLEKTTSNIDMVGMGDGRR